MKAWVITRLVLGPNKHELTFSPADAIRMAPGLAAGERVDQDVARWFRERLS